MCSASVPFSGAEQKASCAESFSPPVRSSSTCRVLLQVSESCSFAVNIEQTVAHNYLQIAIRWMLITVNKN